MTRRGYDPDAYDPDAFDKRRDAWDGYRDDRPVDPIDIDAFNAEQDHIAALIEKERKRVQAPSATIAPWNDRCCDMCKGRKMYEGMPCPDCYGTGAESYIIEGKFA